MAVAVPAALAWVGANIATVAAVASVVGTVASVSQQRSAGKKAQAAADVQIREQAVQRKAQNRKQEIINNRARKERVRRFRIMRGEQQNEAALAGVQSSSGAQGAGASLATQFASGEGFVTSQLAGDAAVSASQTREAAAVGQGTSAQLDAGRARQLGAISGTLFQASGGFGQIAGAAKDIFNKPSTGAPNTVGF